MANKRWTENEPLQKFDNYSFPITDMNEGAGGVDKQAGVSQFKKMIEHSVLNGATLPTCRSFNDPEYLKPSYWNFANISNTEDKPDNLKEHQVGFAHLEVVAGTDEAQTMGAKNYVVQKLTYVDITANTIRENFRGVLLTDEGAYSNTTGWHCSTDSSDIALSLGKGATMNGELVAGQDWVTGEINTLKNNLEDGTTVVAKSKNADISTNAGYSGNSAMLGGLTANRYALKSETAVAIVGNIQLFGCEVKPEQGWLLCDGSPLDVSTYPRLAETIGVKFDPNGAVVKLPDLRNKVAYGASGEYALGKYIDEGLPNITGTNVFLDTGDENSKGFIELNLSNSKEYQYIWSQRYFATREYLANAEEGRKYWEKETYGQEPTDTIYGNSRHVKVDGVALNWYIKY